MSNDSKPNPRLKRLWLFRAATVVLGFVLLSLIELGLRFAGFGYSVDFIAKRQVGGASVLTENGLCYFRASSPRSGVGPTARLNW